MSEKIQVHIDEKAKEWIGRKGGIVTIRRFQVRACCVGGAVEVDVKYQRPRTDLNQYHAHTIDQIDVFVEKTIPLKREELTLQVAGLGWFKHIVATGVERF